jgi:two-component system response regulator CpxR
MTATENTGFGEGCSILLVDDDVELCRLMKEFFARQGYSVDCEHNGRDGLSRAMGNKYELVILDGMLPMLDGFEVLRQLRKRHSVPVIMLTALTREKERITGLDAGADDYLPKPFGPNELLARIRAVMRRYKGQQLAEPELVRVGPLELNPVTRSARRSGRALELTGTEFQILEMLMRSPGRVVTRDEIAVVLYQREISPFERSLDVHVSRLRKKIEGGPSAATIRSIRGTGYMLACEDRRKS